MGLGAHVYDARIALSLADGLFSPCVTRPSEPDIHNILIY